MTDQILSCEVTKDDVVENHNLVRVVRWYDKNGDKLVGQSTLQDIKLSDIQDIFGESKDNPMYDCYPVNAFHVNQLKKFVEDEIDIDYYDYFVECEVV
ncbi:DUF7683 domain-containing protein [Argonema antarcticum]|uniref:DUF7683 domain-containing protein n=1 Tax=Argonema antarcticum TaxID=2942763 RepID=UPI002011F1B9|nr:hypothetical protein [Argonema antarcticum]MCL1472002.1 hypothetical protein [Argonema antarcticum A004/B2]